MGLVGRNLVRHVGIQISHEMLKCKFSKFDLEICENRQLFLQFFSISQFRVNEHCKQIRSIHRELKSESDSFIQFAKRVVKKFKKFTKSDPAN